MIKKKKKKIPVTAFTLQAHIFHEQHVFELGDCNEGHGSYNVLNRRKTFESSFRNRAPASFHLELQQESLPNVILCIPESECSHSPGLLKNLGKWEVPEMPLGITSVLAHSRAHEKTVDLFAGDRIQRLLTLTSHLRDTQPTATLPHSI